MRPRPFRLGQAIAVVLAVAFILGVIILRADDPRAATARAGFDLAPGRPGGPVGLVYLEAARSRLTGTVVVWRLRPGARHGAALRGPGARCPGPGAQVVAPLRPLVAGEDGVASARIDVPLPSTGFDDGLGLTVHAGTDPATATVACGIAPRTLEP